MRQTHTCWALLALTCGLGARSVLADILGVPVPYPTIQAAIDAAVNDDTVLVADGTYTGLGNRDLDFGGRAITVRSENGAGACIIDIQGSAGDPHRAFHFHSGETAASVVEGFTIQNGFINRGGAALCEADSSPLFQSCVFQHNSVSQAVAEDGGGAVYVLSSSPTFIDCDFLQNQAEANFLFGGGGAVQSQSDSNPTFIGCAFSENSAIGATEPDGGAVAIWDGGHPEFFSCTFTENQAYWDGAVLNFSSVTMHDCHFQDNAANGGAAGAYGLYGAPFGGGSSELVNCSFVGNSSTGNAGGAVVVQLPGTSATFTNCLFANNHATNRGGGMWFRDDTEVVVTNCTFSGNTAGDPGGALSVRNGAFVAVDNSVLWNNAPDEVHLFNAVLSISYSDIQGVWAGTENINADPLFVDPDGPDNDPDTWEDNDYRLSAGSPAIDAADNTAVPKGVVTDLDDNPRFVDDPNTTDTGNGDPPIVDMGAYEFQPTPCPWDLDGDGNVGVKDLLFLLGLWGLCKGCSADFDRSGDVGVKDLLFLLGNWGPCP